VTVLKAVRHHTKPDRGIVRSLVETMNQHGEVVMTRTAIGIMRCRDKT
jgi:hypothetical protein